MITISVHEDEELYATIRSNLHPTHVKAFLTDGESIFVKLYYQATPSGKEAQERDCKNLAEYEMICGHRIEAVSTVVANPTPDMLYEISIDLAFEGLKRNMVNHEQD